MRYHGSATPEQLAILHQIFNDRCQAGGIGPGHPEHEILALRIMNLFESGAQTAEDLTAALDVHDYRR